MKYVMLRPAVVTAQCLQPGASSGLAESGTELGGPLGIARTNRYT